MLSNINKIKLHTSVLALFLSLASVTLIPRQAQADPPPKNLTDIDLAKAQNSLTNQTDRNKVLVDTKEDPRVHTLAVRADEAVQKASFNNPQLKEKFYQFTTNQLLPWIYQTAHGDTNQMVRLSNEFNSNPGSFVQRLPASMKQDLKQLISEVDAAQKASSGSQTFRPGTPRMMEP